jgi:hypothetical protein
MLMTASRIVAHACRVTDLVMFVASPLTGVSVIFTFNAR